LLLLELLEDRGLAIEQRGDLAAEARDLVVEPGQVARQDALLVEGLLELLLRSRDLVRQGGAHPRNGQQEWGRQAQGYGNPEESSSHFGSVRRLRG
jgi:hypothetical protein